MANCTTSDHNYVSPFFFINMLVILMLLLFRLVLLFIWYRPRPQCTTCYFTLNESDTALSDRVKYVDDIFQNLSDIPKKIHVSWKTKAILSPKYDKFYIVKQGIRSLQSLNPEYELILHDDDDVHAYLRQHLSESDYKLIKSRKIVEQVDLWRLLKMYYEGGIYTDIDRLHDTPLRDVLGKPNIKCMLPIFEDTDFTQDFMISSPGNEIHRLAIELNLQRRKSGWKGIFQLGPATYFHAATYVLLGDYKATSPSQLTLMQLRHIISHSKYLDTFKEFGSLQLTYRGVPELSDKYAFYEACNVQHWMS